MEFSFLFFLEKGEFIWQQRLNPPRRMLNRCHGSREWLTDSAIRPATSFGVQWVSILTFFYTDYAGVSPAIVGSVMLLSRCSGNIFVSFMLDDVFNNFSCNVELFSQCTRSKFWMSPNMNSTNINNLFWRKF